MRSKEELKGIVERVVFTNKATGFTVLELNSDEGQIMVIGVSPEISEGEYLTVYGEYVHHKEYGNQFKGDFFERLLPDSAVAITKYLSGGAVRGIGPKTAVKLVERFGDDTLNVMANNPERISEIRGISKKSAEEISNKVNEIIAIKSMMEELGNIELSSMESIKLFDRYGMEVIDMVYDNPYILCGYPLYKSFEFADTIALNIMYFSPNDKRRVFAAVIYILRHNLSNGHTCLPLNRLVVTAARFISLQEEEIYGNINSVYEDGSIYLENIYGETYVFLPETIKSEQYISDRLNLLNSIEYKTASDIDSRIRSIEERVGIVYEELQRTAIRSSLKYGAVVINGGPGTGKTTALKAVLEICEEQGDRVVLAAPTGRAAKRITEITGREAYTIHRLLEVDFGNDIEKIRFLRNENNPLKYDVVIIDEMSMVDVSLFESLLRGITPQCRLIMVGDSNQIPAIGAGNLLDDVVNSGHCQVVSLNKVFRQSENSGIIINAHRVVNGDYPLFYGKYEDVLFIETDRFSTAEMISNLASEELPKRYALNPKSDIQVLTPQRKGYAGSDALNIKLRESLNPKREDKQEVVVMGRLFREGDRVMQIKNNYAITYENILGETKTGIFNGEIGIICRIEPYMRTVTVEFEDVKIVEYSYEMLHELEPAFSITIHKSQGSEFPAVILALSEVAQKLRYRSLLYTAMTRAKKLFVIVGDKSIINQMVDNNSKKLRFTGLKEFIRRG